MKRFSIIPLADKIYILVGPQAAGKSHFVRSLVNVMCVDDISLGFDAKSLVEEIMISWKFGDKQPYVTERVKKYSDDSTVLIFITNDEVSAQKLQSYIIETLNTFNKKGYQPDEKQYIKNN